MMKKFTLSVFFSFLLVNIAGQKLSLSETLNVLDKTLENHAQYTLLREKHINAIIEQKNSDKSVEVLYTNNKDLIKEYMTYSCGDAIRYIEANIKLANRMKNPEYELESKIMLAKAYAYAGLFSASYEALKSIHSKDLPDNLRIDYFTTFYQLYNSLIKYTNDDQYGYDYRQEMREYLDSTLLLIPIQQREHKMEMMYKYFLEKKYDLIINELSKQILTIDPGTHEYAIVSSFLANTYKAKNENQELQKLYLAQAAITDARLAIKDHSALLDLAILLNSDSNPDRSYRYVRKALDDANFYNSRHRSSMIIKSLPIIEKTYLDKIEKQKKSISLSLTLIGLLAAGLLFVSIYTYRQTLIINKARRSIKQLNERLDESNHTKR